MRPTKEQVGLIIEALLALALMALLASLYFDPPSWFPSDAPLVAR